MTRPINTAAIEKSTGRDRRDWVAVHDAAGAKNLPHNKIAGLAHDTWGITGWWAQSVTEAYEQQIGRRIPGQDCNGEFSMSVSKTVPGPMDEDWRPFWKKPVAELGNWARPTRSIRPG